MNKIKNTKPDHFGNKINHKGKQSNSHSLADQNCIHQQKENLKLQNTKKERDRLLPELAKTEDKLICDLMDNPKIKRTVNKRIITTLAWVSSPSLLLC